MNLPSAQRIAEMDDVDDLPRAGRFICAFDRPMTLGCATLDRHSMPG
jgi:hypothetical protein